jgi:hypothetical protein
MRLEELCGDCGARLGMSTGDGAYLWYGGPVRWWHAPRQVVQALRMSRTWQPPPLFYLIGVVAGALLGLVADVLLGVTWWLVALAGPVVIFALSLVGLFRRSRYRRSLRLELLRVLAPKRHMRLTMEEEEERYRSADLPLYGVADWSDQLYVSGSYSGDAVDSITLSHATGFEPDDPKVEISVRRHWFGRALPPGADVREIEDHEERAARDELVCWLAGEAARGTDMPDPDEPEEWFEERSRRVDALEASLREREWEGVDLDVDRDPVPFAILRHDDLWIGLGRIADVYVSIASRGIEAGSIRLVSVDDIEPYIEGLRALRDHWRQA